MRRSIMICAALCGLAAFTATAHAEHSVDERLKGLVVVVNPNGGDTSDRVVVRGRDAIGVLAWLARNDLAEKTTGAIAYRGQVYRSKAAIKRFSSRFVKDHVTHPWPTYAIIGRDGKVKIPPREFVIAVSKHFGPKYAYDAVRVSYCESGWRTNAKNGQYLGTFQMGNWARSGFGHGGTYDAQAYSAAGLFFATGATWRPWECKPWWIGRAG